MQIVSIMYASLREADHTNFHEQKKYLVSTYKEEYEDSYFLPVGPF